jgi:hypothetical protein
MLHWIVWLIAILAINDDFQEYKLCKGKDVVKETHKISSSHLVRRGRGSQLILVL